ncbi:CKLF-like MARVEL transmembrane domain-containing protein 3 isoform X2 [Narcine bancroftii]|uniref:CKLF-like MARVEL transmembrane domain-containing protein 3 isoform X2 n=1 Tax=Narcine bancroftii TaxID=1343680 RepID=UPI003832090A
MGSRSKQEVYQNFMDFYQQAVASGNLSPCTGEEQMRQGRLFLNSVPNSGQRFQFLDFYRLALHFIESKGGPDHGEDGFRGLSKGFELLEMLAVNLYLWPWRKEIKSIKAPSLGPSIGRRHGRGLAAQAGAGHNGQQSVEKGSKPTQAAAEPPGRQNNSRMEVNFLFVKSRRSVLKILEMVLAFVAFICFAASFNTGAFLAVPLMETFITLAFYLLYLLKFDSKITQLFWPLMDSLNSAFAALLLLIICITALVVSCTVGVITGAVLTFIILICYLASSMVYFITAPLIEFLLAVSVYYVYVTKVVERFRSFHFPLIDFLRCITAAIIFFAISIYAVTKSNAASKAAGIFGFIATVVFAFDFYGIFNQLIVFINPQDLPTHTATIKKSTGEEVIPSESESE